MFSLLSISNSNERRFDDESERRSLDHGWSAGAIGLLFFLFSVAMLFAGGLVALLWLRSQHAVWPPPGLPLPHGGFIVATLLLFSVSVALHFAARAVRDNRLTRTRRLLLVSLGLAMAFVAIQGWNWAQFFADVDTAAWRAANLLYFLAALHALHVIGGLVPLMLAVNGLRDARIAAARCALVRRTAVYWHFLDGVWIALLLGLLVPHGA